MIPPTHTMIDFAYTSLGSSPLFTWVKHGSCRLCLPVLTWFLPPMEACVQLNFMFLPLFACVHLG